MRISASVIWIAILGCMLAGPSSRGDSLVPIGDMTSVRDRHSMTKLLDGRILIAGGRLAPNGQQISSTAEIYDPSTQLFTPTGSLNLRRYNQSAILLDDGRVLLLGGWIHTFVTATNTAEIYDPSTGTFSFAGNMTITRSEQPALYKRADGKVLVVGGSFEGSLATATDRIDLFDPTTNQFSQLGTLNLSRHGHAICPLPSGDLLVAGGTFSCCNATQSNLRLQSAELLNPTTGNSSGIAATMHYPHRTSALGIILDDGRCLVAGNESVTRGLDAFNPTTGMFEDLGATSYITRATKLLNGTVLLSGKPGLSIFDPSTNTNHTPGFNIFGDHAAVLLDNGSVLITGGYDGIGERSDALLYTPTFELTFPIPGYSAQNHPVSAVMDNDGGVPNQENGHILAFDGSNAMCESTTIEISSGNGKCINGKGDNGKGGKSAAKNFDCGVFSSEPLCKRKGIFKYPTDNLEALSEINYTGSPYLTYDGHSGYDYPQSKGTPFVAPADGILCVATSNTAPPVDGEPWRDTSVCPTGSDDINGGHPNPWTKFHTFYISHDGGPYTTWYLHSDGLDPSILAQIVLQGYAEVDRHQFIAFIGNKGVKEPHLHIEVRDDNGTLVDPYANELWE